MKKYVVTKPSGEAYMVVEKSMTGQAALTVFVGTSAPTVSFDLKALPQLILYLQQILDDENPPDERTLVRYDFLQSFPRPERV
jgi:hypothetical protein